MDFAERGLSMHGVQLNMFDMIPAEKIGRPVWEPQDSAGDWFENAFRNCVHGGSGFSNGKLRIYAAAELMDRDKLADFIQKEYNVGGHSFDEGFADYNNRGIRITKWKSDIGGKQYAWHRVRDEVLKQIANGAYLEQKEEEQIKKIRDEHEGVLPWPYPRMRYE